MYKQRRYLPSIVFALVMLLSSTILPARPVAAMAADTTYETGPTQDSVHAVGDSLIYLPLVAGKTDDGWPADRIDFDVEWGDDVTIVDQAQMELVEAMDLENHRYTFDAQGVAASGLDLTVGRILVLYNTSLRRISAVEQVGDQLHVSTDYVTLTEAIVNGTLDWDVGVEFDPARMIDATVSGQSVQPNADGTIEFTYTDGPFKYQIKMVLQQESAAIDFSVTKEVGGMASASLTAQGNVQRFRSRDTIVISNHQLQSYNQSLDKMTGEVTLGLVMAASGDNFVNLELPVVLLRYPVVIGVIPVILSLKVQFVVNASVPANGSSQVKVKFTYDSDLGFRYAGAGIESGGRLGAITFGKEIAQTGAPGAISANFGVGYPRVELGIFGETIVPWAQTAFLIGGSYTVFPACQTADALFLGAAGVNLKFFGIGANLGSKTFFQEKKELLRSGNCPESSASGQSAGRQGLTYSYLLTP